MDHAGTQTQQLYSLLRGVFCRDRKTPALHKESFDTAPPSCGHRNPAWSCCAAAAGQPRSTVCVLLNRSGERHKCLSSRARNRDCSHRSRAALPPASSRRYWQQSIRPQERAECLQQPAPRDASIRVAVIVETPYRPAAERSRRWHRPRRTFCDIRACRSGNCPLHPYRHPAAAAIRIHAEHI